MRLTWLTIAAASQLLSLSTVGASFTRDVVQRAENLARVEHEGAVEDALLAKAVPLAEYKAKLRAQGFDFESDPRRLEGDGGGDGDDYYLDANYMYSFSGYSMKYAKCQPVQRFSEDAIQAGEYTPMVTEDLVVLRLCPYRFCSSSISFGCHYNFADYVIGLSDYIRIMIRHKADKQGQLCEWCQSCYGRRKLGEDDQQEDGEDGEDGNNEEDGQNNDEEGDGQQQDEEGDGQQQDEEGDGQNQDTDDAYTAYDNSNDACYNYDTYCFDTNGNSTCQESNDDTYMASTDYLDYLNCKKVVNDEKYTFYVRPRCNGYDETIKMAVFHDQFCSQYAGNEVSLKDFGLGFKESIFKEYYESSSCIDCSESVS
jgi:hypothetical protein